MGMVIAYHVVFCPYGYWLPNDPRGSNSVFVRAPRLLRFGKATTVQHRRSVARDPHDWRLRQEAKRVLKYEPVTFTGKQAQSIAKGFAKALRKNGYVIYACAILPTHVHMVIGRHTYKVEQVVNLLKGAATRQLIEDGLHPLAKYADESGKMPSPWGQELRKIFVFNHAKVREKIKYVNENPEKEGLPRQHWSFVSDYPY
jgi:REP element-mobilizing transposase RayT